MLIIGNFNGICGDYHWDGRNLGGFFDGSFFHEDNLWTIVETLNKGHRIVLASSKDTIKYFQNVIYCLMDLGAFGFDLNDKQKKKVFNRILPIDTTDIYVYTYKKYNATTSGRRESATNNIDRVVLNKIYKQIDKMKFDVVIQNPPYNGSLHLDFLEKGLDALTETGKMVIIEPATWLINVRKNGMAKTYNSIKQRINGHIKSVVIENLNGEFSTSMFVPFATTTIDMSRTFDAIDFTCCGENRKVKSVYDCNLVGDYKTIWSIFDKVQSFGNMMKTHITKEDKGEGYWYTKYAEICDGQIIRGNRKPLFYNKNSFEWVEAYFSIAYHLKNNDISSKPVLITKTDKIADNIYGTQTELENWKHFVFNNKLPLFINIVLTIDQHNNSKDFLPWLVDKQYTDDEINKLFGFTDEEIKLINTTIKKYERNSPWFKRYMCGKDAVSDEEVNNFIAEISK